MKPSFSGMVELRTSGVLGYDVVGQTQNTAILHGVRLCGLCGNIWPARDDGLHRLVADEIVRELTTFALYARRYMELCGTKAGVTADNCMIQINDDCSVERDLWKALNRIIHATKLEAQFVTSDAWKHDHLGDLHFVRVKVTSREMATVCICPQSLFYGLFGTDLRRV